MRKAIIVSILSLAVAFPAFAANNIGSSGQDGVSIDLQAKASLCVQQCGLNTNAVDQSLCVQKCALPILEANGINARDAATGQATGKIIAGECQAACRLNLQGSPDALNACLRACNGVGPASGARLLPTVNKVVDTARDAASGQATGKRQYQPIIITKEFKAEIEAHRADMKDAMDKRREELKTKLDAFKDQNRARLAGQIADSLTKLNERITNQMTEQIGKMNDLMVRIAAGDVDGDGTVDIAAANTAIADAAAAVTAQAGNTYTVTVTTEDKLKVDVGAAREKLRADLKAVEDKMKAARAAVRKAAIHVDASAHVDTSVETNTNTQ